MQFEEILQELIEGTQDKSKTIVMPEIMPKPTDPLKACQVANEILKKLKETK